MIPHRTLQAVLRENHHCVVRPCCLSVYPPDSNYTLSMAVWAPLILSCMVLGSRAIDTIQYGALYVVNTLSQTSCRANLENSMATATYSVANQLGIFEQYDLQVVYNQVPNSTAAFTSILSGRYDILTATVDNALNYRFNQNQKVTVLGQLDQGPDLVLASIPSIKSVSELKGKPIIVDSPVSGYAYLLRKLLSSSGLELANGDYYFMVRERRTRSRNGFHGHG